MWFRGVVIFPKPSGEGFTPSPSPSLRLLPPPPRSVRASHCRFLGCSGCFFFRIAFQLRFSIIFAPFRLPKSIPNRSKLYKKSTNHASLVSTSFLLPFGILFCRTIQHSNPQNHWKLISFCSFFYIQPFPSYAKVVTIIFPFYIWFDIKKGYRWSPEEK